MEISDSDLEIAYKYPFSSEARSYIAGLHAGFDPTMLEKGRLRLDEAIKKSRIEYSKTAIRAVKQTYIVSYLYARMLVSALNSRIAIDRYVTAEARRSGDALQEETEGNIAKIAKEIGLGLSYDRDFSIKFTDFLSFSPKTPDFALVHQEMEGGIVHIQKYRAVKIVENAIAAEISKTLPIPAKGLPKEVVAYARTIKLPVPKVSVKIDSGRYEWIARLIANPIGDVRHRTVNLILAPYLVNVKGMTEEDATKAIIDYIERCKRIDPNTKVNESYIKYQCRYAKSKGSKPLSYERARELLKDVVDF